MSIYYISTGGHRGMKARYYAEHPARKYTFFFLPKVKNKKIIFPIRQKKKACGDKLNSWDGVLTNPRSSPYDESSFYCKWTIQQPEDVEPTQRDSMTLAITISGTISKGFKSLMCRNYLNYVAIRGKRNLFRLI